MFTIREAADAALLQANGAALLLLAEACVLFPAATVVLPVRAAEGMSGEAAPEESPLC